VRITTVFRKLLGVTQLIVDDVDLAPEALSLHVRPSWKRCRCGNCRMKAPGYDRQPLRRWRHLSWGRVQVYLLYAPHRVECRNCGVQAEAVPWAEGNTRFTLDFEEMVAYLVQATNKTKVTKLMNISWATVGRIVERVVARRLDTTNLDELERIGVDEFSYRKRHRYVTIVVDHDRRRVVWAKKGRSSETLGEFFKELGPERCSKIEQVTIDMSPAYIKAIGDWLPEAEVIFDRFHVQKLASDAVDEVRRSLMRAIEDKEEARAIKGTRFALLKNPWDLTRSQKSKLSEVQRKNKPLYRAYLLKETLAAALDYLQPKRATDALRDWISWASRSRLEPFVKAARTIRKHFDGIIAYVGGRLTNGFTEGINNKLRMVARRAFGFHSADALIAMLFLTCGGIRLDPPLPGIHPQKR